MDTNNTLNNSYALNTFDQIKKFKGFSSNISISDISKWFSKNFTSLTDSISLGCKNVSAKAMPILDNVVKEANKELMNFMRFFQDNPIAATIMGLIVVGTVALLINNHIKSKNIQELNGTIREKDKELETQAQKHNQDMQNMKEKYEKQKGEFVQTFLQKVVEVTQRETEQAIKRETEQAINQQDQK